MTVKPWRQSAWPPATATQALALAKTATPEVRIGLGLCSAKPPGAPSMKLLVMSERGKAGGGEHCPLLPAQP